MAVARRLAKGAGKCASHKGPPGIIPGQPAAGHHPFASRAQQRLFFANPKLRRWAIGKAHATGEHCELGAVSKARYRALPDRKGSTFHRVPLHPSQKGRSLG
jgi:hypothetical protein